jgi:hypothetical protein
MVECVECNKEITEDEEICCEICGAPLCQECAVNGLCAACTELWIAEIDLENAENET